MRAKKSREINVFTVSFLDVFANTIGGLSFLLLLAIMMVGTVVFVAPKIVTRALPDAYHEQDYLASLAAREGLGKYRWSFSGGEPPQGIDLDAETGELHGRPVLGPTDASTKEFVFEVRCESITEEAKGNGNVDTKRYTVRVHREAPINSVALRIVTDAVLPAAYRHQPYPLTLAAEGGQPPYHWSGQLPTGLALTPGGQIAGVPTQTGKYSFTARVVSTRSEQQEKTFVLDISDNYPPPPPTPPLQVVTREVPSAVADRSYALQLAGEGGAPPYIWQALSGLPAWLQGPQDRATFSGKPRLSDIGETDVVWQVRDSGGRTAQSEPILLHVLPPSAERPEPLRVLTQSLPDGRVAVPYSLAFAIEGGFPPYQVALAATDADFGLTLLPSNRTLSGVPAKAGLFPLSLSVVDKSGQDLGTKLALRVHPPVVPVRVLSAPIATARAGHAFSLALSAVGGHPPYRWRIKDGQLPRGLSFDLNNGVVSGIPEAAGDDVIRVTAADAENIAASDDVAIRFEILTQKGMDKLHIVTETLPVLLAGQPTDFALACEGGEPPYEWQSEGVLPSGLRVERGRVVGIPKDSGHHTLRIVVSDSSGERADASFKLIVKRVAPFWIAALLAVIAGVAVLAITVLARNLARAKPKDLRIASDRLPNARASFEYCVQLACIGGVGPYTWRVVEGTLPLGLELSPDGRLAGCPYQGVSVSASIDVPFTVEVRDAAGRIARQEL
jgi:hypothetical protein